jgi:hypothetical protein
MSEFSESYHLRSNKAEDAIQLLQSVRRKGYVYQPAGGWVSFVAEGGTFEPDERIVAAAKHPILHFVSAEDHGWSFGLYDKGKPVSRYGCAWENDVTVEDAEYSRDAIQRLVPSAHAPSLDEFERRMHPADIDEVIEVRVSRIFAEAIGLEHYEWLAYDSIASDSPDDHPDVTEVT